MGYGSGGKVLFEVGPEVLRLAIGGVFIKACAAFAAWPFQLFHEEPADVMHRIARSRFLRGGGERGWVATFDWLIRNDTSAVRILEGVYDDKPQAAPPKQRAWLDDVELPAAAERARNLVRQATAALPEMPR